MQAWADVPSGEPVPRPRTVVSARDFFVYVLTFAALVTTALNLTFLLFDIIDLLIDNDDNTLWLVRSMRWHIAALMVAGPVYVWLTMREGRQQRDDPARRRSVIRVWVTSLTLLIAALTFMGNLIWVLSAFLNGDLRAVARALYCREGTAPDALPEDGAPYCEGVFEAGDIADPAAGAAYSYARIVDLRFRLCADFHDPGGRHVAGRRC